MPVNLENGSRFTVQESSSNPQHNVISPRPRQRRAANNRTPSNENGDIENQQTSPVLEVMNNNQIPNPDHFQSNIGHSPHPPDFQTSGRIGYSPHPGAQGVYGSLTPYNFAASRLQIRPGLFQEIEQLCQDLVNENGQHVFFINHLKSELDDQKLRRIDQENRLAALETKMKEISLTNEDLSQKLLEEKLREALALCMECTRQREKGKSVATQHHHVHGGGPETDQPSSSGTKIEQVNTVNLNENVRLEGSGGENSAVEPLETDEIAPAEQ